MKTIIKTYNVYNYNELDVESKEKVKQWLLNDEIRNDIFYDDIMYKLYEKYPQSDLKVQYSLSYCQGDGLNIYGNLNLYDCTKDKKIIELIDKIDNNYIEFSYNNRYCYSLKFMENIEDIISNITYYSEISKAEYKILYGFIKNVLDELKNLEKQFKNMGYDYLYNISDEEAVEECETNGYLFLEDGTFYE